MGMTKAGIVMAGQVRACIVAVWMLALILSAPGVAAADYPVPGRPVRVIVPYGAGGIGDIAARLIADRLAERIGVPFVIENRAGANGIIGTEMVVRAQGDGHTLLVTSIGSISINPNMYKALPYEPSRDLAPVAPVISNVMMFVASQGFPANSFADAIRHIRASPGKYAYGTYGAGSLNYLIMAALGSALDLKMVEVPFKGANDLQTALISGQIGVMWDALSSVFAQVKAGKTKALAVTAAQRSTLAPDVPTLRESGVAGMPDLLATAWTGMFAPGSTPRETVDRLNQEVTRSLQEPVVKTRFGALSAELFPPYTPKQFSDFLQEDRNRWARIVTDAGLKNSQ